MEQLKWDSVEEFLSQNEDEFIHVDSEEEYQDELDKIRHENEIVAGIINGTTNLRFKCKRWKPVKKKICKWKKNKYVCVVHTRHVCVER